MKSSLISTTPSNTGTFPQVFFQEWKTAALIFAGSMLLRVIYLLSLGDDPWLHYPIVDEVIYQDMAIALMKDPYSLFPFFRPPLFPALLAVWYTLVGVGDSFIDVRLLNAFLGSVSIVLAYFIALRFFDRKVAIISSAISSTAGILVHLHTSGLTTSAFMVLFLGSILLMITSYDRDNPSSIIYAVLAGLLLGLSALGRPVSLIPAGAVFVWIAFSKDMRISHRVVGISSMAFG
ncbi:MAG TPA: phospholipid carrier-dependent glycosyltransferase, partial [Bacteroidetes bacterium]|nr:phospholipid carrier-dependent glycosyltransferase [Bacteroidota bacterium]HEX04165.1 phospholipid carrier-dependent glycosyltransferase [Bacteroidota bacterium]